MKSTSLFPDDSPDEPVDITRLSLRNLSNCVNLEALRSQCQQSLPKVDSVRDSDDSGENSSDDRADDEQTLRDFEDLCEIPTCDSQYDMWYVPGKAATDDNLEQEYYEKRTAHPSEEGHLNAATRPLNETGSSSSRDVAWARGTCYGGNFGDQARGACYGGNLGAAVCRVFPYSEQTKTGDKRTKVARKRPRDDDDDSLDIDEETSLLDWNEHAGQSRRLGHFRNSEHCPYSMQNSQTELYDAPTRDTAHALNITHMSKQELLHLWKSSELQLNYLLQNTLRENIELKKSLARLKKRPIKDTAV